MDAVAEIGRKGLEWLALMASSDAARIHAPFQLPAPISSDHENFAQALALMDLGVAESGIFAEPRLRRSWRKAERDSDLGRDTIHMAPVWRHADADETGVPALILPVGEGICGRHCSLSLWRAQTQEAFAREVVDLIAIPLDGSRPLSSTGHTLAVGEFALDGLRLVLNASPLAWLKAHLARVSAVTADTPGHLVEALHFPLTPPDYFSTLLIEPQGLEWRPSAARCVIPFDARQLVVPDSRKAAVLIDQLMHVKERARPMPQVIGPKAGAAAP